MFKLRQILPRWFPALVVMLAIFVLSAQPSHRLPNFSWADAIVKKGGHMLGYGLLALAYWHGFGWVNGKCPLAWLLAVLYAATDEYHQSFVNGRGASFWDVIIFDNLGALIALWLAGRFVKQKRPDESA